MSGWAGFWIGLGLIVVGLGIGFGIVDAGQAIADGLRRFSTGAKR